MINDITDAFKARLYETTSTPLLGSFVISWIFINHPYILIYFGTFENKLSLIESYSFGSFYYKMWLLPLFMSLLYVFAYPYILNPILKFTLQKQKEREDIKKEIEDRKLLTIEQSRDLKEQLYKLQEDIDRKSEKIEFQRTKIETLENNIAEFENQLDNLEIENSKNSAKVSAKVPDKRVEEINEILPDKYTNNEIDDKFKEIYTDEEINILRAIYENNILEKQTINGLISDLLNIDNLRKSNMVRIDIETAIRSLENKKAIQFNTLDQFFLSPETKHDMREMFKK